MSLPLPLRAPAKGAPTNPAYLVELDALFSHSGRRVLKAENPQLRLDQVGGVPLHGGHVEHESPEVRIEECVGDDVCKKRGTTGPSAGTRTGKRIHFLSPLATDNKRARR